MIHEAKQILLQLHSRLYNRFEIEYLVNETPRSEDLDRAKIKQMLKLYSEAGIIGISFNFEVSLLGLASNEVEERKELIRRYKEVVETSQKHLSPDQPLKHSTHNKDNSPIQARQLFVDLLKYYIQNCSQEYIKVDMMKIRKFEEDQDKSLVTNLENAIFEDVKIDLNHPNLTPSKYVQDNRLRKWLEFQSSELRSAQQKGII